MNVTNIIRILERHSASGNSSIGIASEEYRSRIDELRLPDDIAYLVTTCWPQVPDRDGLGEFKFYSTAQLFSSTNAELTQRGLIAIGSSGCGDSLLINFRTSSYSVDLLDYNYAFDDQNFDSYREQISDSFEQFVIGSVDTKLP